MKKNILILIFLVSSILCKSQNTSSNINSTSSKNITVKILKPSNNLSYSIDFCKELAGINLRDQMYRQKTLENGGLVSKIAITIDSIYSSRGIVSINNEPAGADLTHNEQLTIGNLASKIVCEKYPKLLAKYKNKINSLDSLQIIEDNKNTELLISIIKTRGYPNKNNCECKGIILKRLIVFRHSQRQYFDEIRVLIKQEYKAGRLPEKKHKLFLDHINGRTGKDL